MEKANKEIRDTLKTSGLPYWRVGDILGINEITLCRWLRKPLPVDKEQQILQAIEVLKGGADNE